MRRLAAVLALALCAAPGWAQTFGVTGDDGMPLPDLSAEEIVEGGIVVETLDVGPGESLSVGPDAAPVVRVAGAAGAVLRGLDKVTGEVQDFDVSAGGAIEVGRLDVMLSECRYPVDNPSGDAYAHLTIRAEGAEAPAFDGWMIASSPALSALDHPRYDVWVIRCNNS